MREWLHSLYLIGLKRVSKGNKIFQSIPSLGHWLERERRRAFQGCVNGYLLYIGLERKP